MLRHDMLIGDDGRVPQIDIEAEIDRLYSLPLEEFVGARDELARRLREAKDKEAAEAVKGLRKPTVVAWAVNQLVHRHRDEIDGLLAARDRIREDPAATRERRKLLGSLARRAGTVLEESGQRASADAARRISTTLLAATSGTQEEAFRAGRLTRELQPEGFEGAFGLDLPETAVEPEESGGREGARDEAERLSALASEAEREARDLDREATAAEAEAERAHRAATRARRRAGDAAGRAEKARTKADEAIEQLE